MRDLGQNVLESFGLGLGVTELLVVDREFVRLLGELLDLVLEVLDLRSKIADEALVVYERLDDVLDIGLGDERRDAK